MCFVNLNGLTDSEIDAKIQLINNKLNSAYNTTISQNYIDTLENTLDQLYTIQDERQIVANAAKPAGMVLETDPQLYDQENKKPSKEVGEVTKKKEFNGPKIVKTYINKDSNND